MVIGSPAPAGINVLKETKKEVFKKGNYIKKLTIGFLATVGIIKFEKEKNILKLGKC